MREHLLAGVGVGGIALVQYGHAAIGEPAAHQAKLHGTGADVRQFLARKEDLRLAARSKVKKSASAIGCRPAPSSGS